MSENRTDLMFKAVFEIAKNMAVMTCLANVRPQCLMCAINRLDVDALDEWLASIEKMGVVRFNESREDVEVLDEHQMYRQAVIWGKESTEAMLEEPCTMGDMIHTVPDQVILDRLLRVLD